MTTWDEARHPDAPDAPEYFEFKRAAGLTYARARATLYHHKEWNRLAAQAGVITENTLQCAALAALIGAGEAVASLLEVQAMASPADGLELGGVLWRLRGVQEYYAALAVRCDAISVQALSDIFSVEMTEAKAKEVYGRGLPR